MKRHWAWLLLLAVVTLSGCDAFVSEHERVARGRAAIEAGDWVRASTELRRALEKAPDDPEARLLLARVNLGEGDPQSAASNLDRAAAHGAGAAQVAPLRVQVRLARGEADALLADIESGSIVLEEPAKSIAQGRAQLLSKHPDAAVARFQAALEVDKHSMDARLGLAEALAAGGQTDRALEVLAEALREFPDEPAPQVLKGQLYLRRGQAKEASEAFDAALGHVVKLSPAARLSLRGAAVDAALAQRDIARAQAQLDAARKESPDSLYVLMLGARMSMAKGDYTGAIADLQRITVAMPELVPAKMMLAVAHVSTGSLFQAEAQLADVVRLAPDNLEARKLLARVRLDMNQPEAAMKVMTPALQADGTDPGVYSLLGAAQVRSGNLPLAIETLERSLATPARSPELEMELAGAYLAAGRTADGTKVLQAMAPGTGGSRRDVLTLLAAAANGGWRAARDQLEAALRERPRDVELLNLAAAWFANNQDLPRARALLDAALKLDAKRSSTLMNVARVDLMGGDSAAAESALRTALSSDPDNMTVRVALAGLLGKRGGSEEAIRLLEDPSLEGPRPVALLLTLAQVQFDRKDLAAGTRALEQAVATQPNSAALARQAGRLLMDQQQYAQALVQFRRAVQIDSGDADTWLDMGNAQLALDDPAAAKESISRALQLQPDSIRALGAMTMIDVRARQFDAALERVRAVRPGDARTLALEGDVLTAAQRFGEAAQAYDAALKSRPDAALAVRAYQARRSAGARSPEAPLSGWLAAHPDDYRVRLVLSDFLISSNKPRKAVTELEAVRRQMPGNAAVLNNLALMYQQLGDPRALEAAREAFRLAPRLPAVADTLGWVLTKGGKVEEALPLLQQAAAALPGDPSVQFHYADALATAGRTAEARVVVRKVVTAGAFPERAEAERLLDKLGM